MTKHVHFVGIKGVAMTALALWYAQSGWQVSGSDSEESFPTDELLSTAGIIPLAGFSESHITDKLPDLVIYTGAHGGKNNIEVVTARTRGVTALPHGAALGEITAGKKLVAVAGSHGKTTTSAMIAAILQGAGRDVSWTVGCGQIISLGASGHAGNNEWFVTEADEYVTDPSGDLTPRFLWLRPEILLVTNIDYDHPDVYASLDEVKSAFQKLQERMVGKKLTVINADDQASRVLADNNHLSYGVSPASDLQIGIIKFSPGVTEFQLYYNKQDLGFFSLRVPGKHNIANAAAASLIAYKLGVEWSQIRQGLARFGGTKRRFEQAGEVGGIKIYDDYAHHPQEIVATIAGARSWFPKSRIIVVFQPHTYTRTKSLLSQFAQSLREADVVIIGEIYASAREEVDRTVSGKILAEKVCNDQVPAYFSPDYSQVENRLDQQVKAGDLVIFMGAGDIYHWSKKYVSHRLDNFR